MKIIWSFILSFLILSVILACIQTGDALPLVGVALSYGCYICVFKGMKIKDQEYDPVDYMPSDFDYRQ